MTCLSSTDFKVLAFEIREASKCCLHLRPFENTFHPKGMSHHLKKFMDLLALYQLGKDNFYHRDSISGDKA